MHGNINGHPINNVIDSFKTELLQISYYHLSCNYTSCTNTKISGKTAIFIFWSTSSLMSISVFAVSIALSKFLLSWKSRCSTSVVPLAATFSCGEFLKTDSGKLAYTYIWKEIAKQSTRSCDWTTLRTKMAQWSSIFHLKLDKNQNHNTWNIGLGDMLKFVLNQSNHTHTHTPGL